MTFQNSSSKNDFVMPNSPAGWFSVVWVLAILTPLVYFPMPPAVTGHPWKVELVLSLLMLIVFTFQISRQNSGFVFPTSLRDKLLLPLALFTGWSSLSYGWAFSGRSVLHHTLVWGLYLTFFVLIRQIVSSPQNLRRSLTVLGAAAGIVAGNCLIESFLAAQTGETFGFRYAKFAELFAAIFPVFLALSLKLKGKMQKLAAGLSVVIWSAVLLSMSRGAFFAAAAGLFVFLVFRLVSKTPTKEKIRLAAAVAFLLLLTFLLQFAGLNGREESTVISRITENGGQNNENSVSKNIRLLFWNVAREMIVRNPVKGIGADNFGLEFNRYRAVFSSDPANRAVADQAETALPERAHSEYLQILAELGLVGVILFGWFLYQAARLVYRRLRFAGRPDILSQAAAAGMIAFLLSSMVSSFSFRLVQNGIVFFFLLALALRAKAAPETSEQEAAARRFKPVFLTAALLLCLSAFTFSSFRAAGQYLAYRAVKEPIFALAEVDYRRSMSFDPANPSPHFSYGLRLIGEGNYAVAGEHLEEAVAKGLNTIVVYNYLITARSLAGEKAETEKAFRESLAVVPSSVLMRTRYAVWLAQNGRTADSAEQFAEAVKLNDRQARSWRILIDGGAKSLNEEWKRDKNLIDLGSLSPKDAVDAILRERYILYPSEKPVLKF